MGVETSSQVPSSFLVGDLLCDSMKFHSLLVERKMAFELSQVKLACLLVVLFPTPSITNAYSTWHSPSVDSTLGG